MAVSDLPEKTPVPFAAVTPTRYGQILAVQHTHDPFYQSHVGSPGNDVPILHLLNPKSVAQGFGDLVIEVWGNKLFPSTVFEYDGNERASVFDGDAFAFVQLLEADFVTPGVYMVRAYNTLPDYSNTLPFEVISSFPSCAGSSAISEATDWRVWLFDPTFEALPIVWNNTFNDVRGDCHVTVTAIPAGLTAVTVWAEGFNDTGADSNILAIFNSVPNRNVNIPVPAGAFQAYASGSAALVSDLAAAGSSGLFTGIGSFGSGGEITQLGFCLFT